MEPAGTALAPAGDGVRPPLRPMPPKPSDLTDPVDPTALGLSLSRLLVPPLAALRASIEALGGEIDREALPDTRLQSTLDEVTRLARDVQSLVELAAPAPLAPLSCSLEEIAHGALRLLSPSQRARVRYARPVHETRIETDGPVLSRLLVYLLQAALERSADTVLLRVEGERGRATFAVVCHGPEQAFEPRSPASAGSPLEVALGCCAEAQE